MTALFLVEYNAYFDTCALLIILFLALVIIAKKLYKIPSSKVIIVLMVISIITTFFDIMAADLIRYSKNIDDLTYGLIYISILLYYAFKFLIALLFLIYIMIITETANYIFSKKRLLIIVVAPYLIALFFIFSASVNGWMFSLKVVDGAFQFSKGQFYFIYPTVISLYLAYCFALVVRYRILFKRSQIITLTAIVHVSVIAMIIQMIMPGYLVEMFCVSMSLILLLTTVESPADLIDVKTGIASNLQFVNIVKKSYLLGIDRSIVLLKIANFSGIYNVLEYENANKYVYMIAQLLAKKYKLIENYSSYYLDDGLFAFVFNKGVSRIDNIVNDMEKYLLDLDEYDFSLSPYICVCEIPNDFIDYDEFIKFTNNFHNKLDFSSRVVIYNEIKNDINFLIQSNIDEILTNAFKDNELEVYYQPIYDIKNNAFYTAEALVRLNTKDYGFIEPKVFIPLAEKNGMIFEVDEFVLNSVFKFLASDEFRTLGLKYIEVNLSMLECVDDNFVDRISGLIKKYGINPENLNIEVTESVNVNELSKLIENINKIKELGINFSLDDYGTGYSNIERFSKLPIEIVKLDKTLVDLSETQNVSMVLENIINLNSDLERQTIVEGVETKDQMIRFKKLNCDFIQGFYFSEALPLSDFTKFILKNNKKTEEANPVQ